ncbi:amidohydrolase family protein [Alteromonas sp. KUL49]|uniref:amidohydrolase family protein n=1 Tax=Alteromonas sp. KUL49 TaxID=2480798 RepID=UPI00102F1499|nr:amidohydrolase family protein [Alteromonas sp. KUL49]TAP38954.1 amidohydrolase [Alteromonas sp. KUL49]GEA12394.1 hypothetical protein KUL49_27690 [Alteromonas sp. KUL49]
MNFVDPHLHFFALQQGQYGWLKPTNPPFWPDKSVIAKETTEAALLTSTNSVPVAYVHIEAGFDNERPWREIDYLQQTSRLPFRAIATIDLLGNNALSHIETLAHMPSVVGGRHILDDDAVDILRHPKALHTLKHLASVGLMFEAQLNLADDASAKALLSVLEKTPSLKVTLNHGGFPSLFEPSRRWKRNLLELSRSENVAVKLSGWEMQDRQWAWSQVREILEITMAAISHERIMMASNFPLCQWRMPYGSLWQGYEALLVRVVPEHKQALMQHNAINWYDLKGK